MAPCPACGTPNPEIARFCMTCGGPLPGTPTPPTREVRKVVTVVFADVTGSTGLGERLDPESLRAVMGRWFEAMRTVLERHGGTVEKFIGDAVVAVFGVPVLHEDDALRAVRAAAGMRDALAGLNTQLRAERGLEIAMRVGVNTGEVVVGDARAGGGRATGDAVNVAARLQQAAEPGETLLGDSTWRLVRDAVDVGQPTELQVRGRTTPVEARGLLAVRSGSEAIPRRVSGPMVGRVRELAVLDGTFERAVAEEACALVTVLGSPGVGKSRLVHEFLAGVRERALVARGRCLPYGDGITWLPVADILRSVTGFDDDALPGLVRAGLAELLVDAPDAAEVLERLDGPLGLATSPVPREELFWGVRRFVERVAARRPLVLVIDDIQWAEPTLVDLIEHLVDWVTGVPVLVVAMARPELLDTSPGWGGGKPNATTFRLEPLGQDQTESLVDALLEGATLPAAARARIAAAADGNPLYVEQMVEVMLDDGVLRRTDDGGLEVGDLGAITVPPTIQALLAARLDRLAEPDRRVIERAAVVGKEFRRVEVAELSPESLREEVPTRLRSLVRKELIRPDRSGADLDETFRFRHLLIRDAAYEGLPKAERAELHERFASWLEQAGDRLVEADEIIGYHLDQARGYRLALGPDDDTTRRLALRAGHRLADAGVRAIDRDERGAAIRLLSRATVLLDAEPARRFPLLIDLAWEQWSMQAYRDFLATVSEITRVAPALGEMAELRARIWDAAARANMDRDFVSVEAHGLVDEALARFGAAGDEDGMLDALALRHTIELNLAHWQACIAAAHEAWERATRAGITKPLGRYAGWIANATTWGRTPSVADGLAMLDSIRRQLSRRTVHLSMAMASASLHAYAGDAAATDAALDEALTLCRDLGIDERNADFRRAVTTKALDDPEASHFYAMRCADRLASVGETGQRSTILGVAAQACLRMGDLDEAFRLADLGRQLSSEDDAETHMLWRAVHAQVLASRGEHETADQLTRVALEMGATTDSLQVGDVWHARAIALSAAGRAAESRAAAAEARAIWAMKGYANAMRWAEALM